MAVLPKETTETHESKGTLPPSMRRASKGPSGFASVALWPGAGQPPLSCGSKGAGEGGLSVLQE